MALVSIYEDSFYGPSWFDNTTTLGGWLDKDFISDGTNIYIITPIGGVILSGNVPLITQKFYTMSPSGGTLLGGSNSLVTQKFYTMSPSGGTLLGGSNSLVVFAPNLYNINPSGGVSIIGLNLLIKEKIIIMQGNIIFSGTNTIEYNRVSMSNSKLPLQGVGK